MRKQIEQIYGSLIESDEAPADYVKTIAESLSLTEMTSRKSLSRLKTHFEDPKAEIVIVSGERYHEGESDQARTERNARQTAMLKDHLDSNNFSYIPVKGGYIENHGKPNAYPVHENSFVVVNHQDSPNYRPEGILDHFKTISGSHPISNDLGEHIEQESILHKPAGDDIASFHYLSGEKKGKVEVVGRFKGDAGGKFFTELNGKRRFEVRED